MNRKLFARAFIFLFAAFSATTLTAEIESDTRAALKTVNTKRSFPSVLSRADWQNRAQQIREQILVSCGLWPMPEKTPLNAKVFGKIVRDDYTIEKVYFETHPGFFLAGNLYRPLRKGTPPYPAILNPHGHWESGRMANEKEGSIAARCINFAKQGMIAFSYDMVGYNDTFFPDQAFAGTNTVQFYKRHRQFATNEVNMLWNVSLMGLQTWNSIRALDFLESLPDVDKSRLACTGESGGGTQTYILGAIDDRLAAQAPVVMVSHTMQGGCSCENASGLRVDYSNVEIAACAAPRPQILVGATGDWTKDTMKVEGPAIQISYRMMGAEENLRYVLFDFRHNYNQTSREAVYDYFGRYLHPANPTAKEFPYDKEPDKVLRVFPDDKLPAGALSESAFVDTLIQQSKKQFDAIKPRDKKTLAQFKEVMLPAWRHTLQVEVPKDSKLWTKQLYYNSGSNYIAEKLYIGREDRGDRIPVFYLEPLNRGIAKTVILAHPEGKSVYLDKQNKPIGLAKTLLEKNLSVLLVDTFLTGESANWELSNGRQQVEMFFTTYNRTDMQERVQDLITAARFAKQKHRNHEIVICGQKRAGLWAMLASPAVDNIVADCDQLDRLSDTDYLQPDMFVPGLKKIGGFEGVMMLAASNKALLHNAGKAFAESLTLANSLNAMTIHTGAENDSAITEWIAAQK